MPLLEKAGQPLLFTHTELRRFRKVERGLSDKQLDEVLATDGIVGLCPSPESLSGTVVPPDRCPSGCRCEGDIYAFAVQFDAVASVLGGPRVFIGSDFNGGMPHLKPSVCPTGTSLDRNGLHQIGQTSELWSALRKAGADASQSSFHGVENFIEVWARVRPVVVP
jgi:microsomal dipeptidase-like Zn-dependent dipeptidase